MHTVVVADSRQDIQQQQDDHQVPLGIQVLVFDLVPDTHQYLDDLHVQELLSFLSSTVVALSQVCMPAEELEILTYDNHVVDQKTMEPLSLAHNEYIHEVCNSLDAL